MKTFNQYITEATTRGEQGHQALDDYKMSKRTDTPLEVGRVGAKRKKTDAEKKRVKAVGGGKTAPAKSYKPRKDIGTNKPRSKVEQQPTQQRGTAGVKGKEAQKKAYLERKRREKGEKTPTRTQLLTKKTKSVSPKYKPVKATGYTAAERQKITRAGRRLVKDIQKGKEKPISQYDPGIRKD
mgnify:FL=1|tara:strand:- start:148 stop:693 length:546 start_codon:yes stop_codon:yes gene_type:complete